MSVITKLENSYLAILRFVVIVGAGLLLIVSIIMAAGSFALFTGPAAEDTTPAAVDAGAVIQQTVDKSKPNEKRSADKPPKQQRNPSNTSDKVAKIGKLVEGFVSNHSAGRETIDQERLARFINQMAKERSPESLDSFLLGLEMTLEKAFTDPQVIALATAAPQQNGADEAIQGSAIKVSVDLIQGYSVLFIKAQEEKRSKEQERLAKAEESKAVAKLRATYAAGTFGAFLLVVFLSIIVKIERNLRPTPGTTL